MQLTVSFSESLTEEFEYLSYQEPDPNEDPVTKPLSKQSAPSILNSKNNTVGNFGKFVIILKHLVLVIRK